MLIFILPVTVSWGSDSHLPSTPSYFQALTWWGHWSLASFAVTTPPLSSAGWGPIIQYPSVILLSVITQSSSLWQYKLTIGIKQFLSSIMVGPDRFIVMNLSCQMVESHPAGLLLPCWSFAGHCQVLRCSYKYSRLNWSPWFVVLIDKLRWSDLLLSRSCSGFHPNTHHPPTLTFLSCFSAPCGPIWASEDTFW